MYVCGRVPEEIPEEWRKSPFLLSVVGVVDDGIQCVAAMGLDMGMCYPRVPGPWQIKPFMRVVPCGLIWDQAEVNDGPWLLCCWF